MILSLLLPGLARVSFNISGIGSEFYKLLLRIFFFFKLFIYLKFVLKENTQFRR